MVEEVNCFTCLYFELDSLTCHLNPPVYIRKDEWEFPKVKNDSWCGKFVRKHHKGIGISSEL